MLSRYYDPDVFKLFGLLDRQDTPVTVRGAVQRQGEPVQAVVISLRGGWKEIDSGTWKPGDKSTLKVSMALNYFKLTIAGEEVVEVDAKNLVRKVGGIDQMAEIRKAVGL